MSKTFGIKKLLKFCAPILLVGVITIPLTLTSCAPVYKSSWKEIDLSNVDNDKTLGDLKNSSTSLEKLLNGNKKIHDGNYIIFFGSNTVSSSNLFFTGVDNNIVDPDPSDYSLTNSQFWQCLTAASAIYNGGVDFGIYLYMDYEDNSSYNSLPYKPNSTISYDTTWTADDVSAYEALPGVDDDQTDVVEGEYIRQDKSAKKMRSLISFCSTLFGSDYFASDSSSLPYCLIWKDGVPQVDTFKQVTNASDFYNDFLDLFINSSDD